MSHDPRFEERLDSEAQKQAAEWVRALPADDEPDLSWRSALNDRIRMEADRRARKRRVWTLARPAFGLALAASLAAALMIMPRPHRDPGAGSRLEAGLIALHKETVQVDDAVGTGLRPLEVPESKSGADTLDEADLGVL